MDEEERQSPSEIIRHMQREAEELGHRLTSLRVEPDFYEALVLECSPMKPEEVFGIPILSDATLGDGKVPNDLVDPAFWKQVEGEESEAALYDKKTQH